MLDIFARDGKPSFEAIVPEKIAELIESHPEYGSFAGDPINLLWAVPVTREEYDFVVKNGVSDLLHRAKDISRIHIFDGRPKFNL